ncbi:MAG TPA: glycosyltransferase 87 family protein [Polyangia bacterium]|nr:glycosyltransferase 87 family protein [Polyangia bacterium]
MKPAPAGGVDRGAGAAARAATAGAGLAVAGTLALAGWLYAMPASFSSPWGLNQPGLAQFCALWHLPAAALTAPAFRVGFWLLLAAAWTGYGALVAAGLRGGRVPPGALRALAAVAVAAMALGCPPALSADVYGYVGFGRLAALHHLNPLATSQSALVGLGDPVAPFLGGDVASPYGPLWSALSVAVVRAAERAGVAGQVLAFKLLAGVALLAAAAAARQAASAARQTAAPAVDPRAGEAAFAFVALNPLLLIEGPGSGHNDLVMLALVLGAFAAVAAGRSRVAALAAGAAAAVKLVPLLLIPWLAWMAGGGGASTARDGRRSWRAALGSAALALVPLLLSALPFWDGARTFAGLAAWWREGHRGGSGTAGLLLLPVAYAVVSWTVVRTSRDRVNGLATGWALASGAAIVLGAAAWFPWYLGWPLAGLAVRCDRRHALATAALMLLAAVSTARYAG